MRLIDADNLPHYNGYSYSAVEVAHAVESAPTVDAEPMRHGHWIEKMIPTGVSAFGVDELTCEEEACSVCGAAFWVGENKKYCPNCGAKMDEDDNNG